MSERPGEHLDQLSIDAPGADEVAVVPWSILLGQRVRDRAQRSSRYPWVVLATVLLGLFSVGFTITILSVSIPRIAEDLGSDESTLTWLVTGPLLAFAVFGPSAGKLGDLHGHRRVYAWSMVAVVVFAGLTALAWSAPALLAFRILGAATGAAVGPASLALINRMFPRERRAQAMGYWTMVGAGGPVVGVVAGGPIVEAFGWRWIFAAQVPLTLAALILAVAVLPETERIAATRFDVAGAATLAGAATAFLLAVNRGPVLGWSSPAVVGGFVVTPLLAWWFLRIERRAVDPLLPLDYLRRRNFSVPILTQVFTQFAYMGGFIITPLLLQNVFRYGEARTGGLLIARPLAFAVAGPVMGYLVARTGERLAAVGGAFAVFASMIGMATLEPASGDWLVVAYLALSGLGVGMSAPALVASIANAVDDDDLGVVGAMQQMMTQFGVVAGIQLMQTTQAAREPAVGALGSFGDAYLVGAAAAFLGLVFAFFVRSSVVPTMRVRRSEALAA
ncbi:MAG TPA: MFS transporter [Acidimicrobiales bacterium]|nr:MFS transporter [Acidimicrobiales bacterium]